MCDLCVTRQFRVFKILCELSSLKSHFVFQMEGLNKTFIFSKRLFLKTEFLVKFSTKLFRLTVKLTRKKKCVTESSRRTHRSKNIKKNSLVFTRMRYAYFCLSEEKKKSKKYRKTRQTFGSQIRLISNVSSSVYERVVFLV